MTRRIWTMGALPALWLALLALATPTRAGVDLTLLPAHPFYRENAACTEIPAAPFTKMPHTEGDYAICFSYGSADMIAQRIGVSVSPLDLATGFFLADADHSLRPQSRDPIDARAIREARRGLDVTSENNPARIPYIDRLEGGEEQFAVQIADARGLCRESDLPSVEGFRNYFGLLAWFRFRALAAPEEKICRKGLFGLPLSKRRDMADAANLAWLNYVETQCRRFKSPVPLKPVTYHLVYDLETLQRLKARGWKPTRAQRQQAFRRIDYALDHKRYPAIGYSYEVFEKRLPNEGDRDIDHSSVIVARKKIGGVCHYLVQDDSGENCVKFYPKLHDRCVLGRVWLTRKELTETLHSVTYLR